MSKYTEALNTRKIADLMLITKAEHKWLSKTIDEALEIADRLEQADAQAHYLDRMRQTTKSAGYADGYIQAVKDIRGDTE